MENDDDFAEQSDSIDENLLDFEFDDLPNGSTERLDGDSGSDEEIIELVDVVEEPNLELEIEEGDLEGLADEEIEDQAVLELEDLMGPEDLEKGVEDAEALTQELTISDLKDEFNGMVKTQEAAEQFQDEVVDTDLEDETISADSESVDELTGSADEHVPESFQKADEESTDELPIAELEVDGLKSDDVQDEEEMIGISEERIEAIIREVVGDVVERVARETMQSVAERVIGEAIDALKESIESSSE